jgi:DNA-binding NtrC family response regulator
MANEHIIVVDDDETNVNLLKMLLEMDGFQVKACKTIDSAKDEATAETNAFIIDCYLARGASGLDLLDAIRSGQTKAAKDTIVIMTSGDQRLREKALEKQATLFILKPFSPTTLSQQLTQLFKQGTTNG